MGKPLLSTCGGSGKDLPVVMADYGRNIISWQIRPLQKRPRYDRSVVRWYDRKDAKWRKVMTENPYRLARDIRGIGFKTADAIAMKLGIEKTAMIRVRAGISYALTEAMDEGHCGLPIEKLLPLAGELLEVPIELVQTALELELSEGVVTRDQVAETDCVFLTGLYRAEQNIAARLKILLNGTLPWP